MDQKGDQSSALARYAKGPAQLEHAVFGLDDAALDTRVSERGWTVRQIVHHVADGDDLWTLGIKCALGNEEGEFTLRWYWALPQEVWADRWAYSSRSIDVSLALLKATRNHILQLVAHVPDAWQRSINVPVPDGRFEHLTVGDVIRMQGDHAMHHIAQIAAVRIAMRHGSKK